ncbi:hypothetical protein SDC9_16885 [bioreactor metagenome]|uniref:Uncharacterized protein n=1 Tax=bioreactor metagenome TaxID=1076179 RepID=A0A644TVV4_9ZZZZ
MARPGGFLLPSDHAKGRARGPALSMSWRLASGGGGGERLVEVGDQVGHILDPDRQPHHARRGAGGDLLFLAQLAMRGRGRVDDQRARIAEVRDMAEELQIVDELDAGVIAALHRHGEERAGALRADLRDPVVPGRGRQAGPGDIVDARILLEPLGHGLGVRHVLFHAQAERLDPHQRVMRRLRVHRHAEVAQPDRDRVEGIGHRPERLVERQPVIGRLGGAERGELVRGRPVELAGIDDRAAHHRAVAGEVFRRRMHHQRRAMLDRAAQIGRGEGVVDDQRQAEPVGHLRHRIEIGDIAAGVRDRLAEDRTGVLVHRGFDRRGIVEIDEGAAPAEALHRQAELGDGAAVKPGRGDDVQPRPHQREERHDLRRMARGATHRPRATLERGDAVCQRRDRRVGQARIDVAHFLQVEEPRRVVGVFEDIGGGLVDRHLAGPGGRIGFGPGVHLQRVKGKVGHMRLPECNGANPIAGSGALQTHSFCAGCSGRRARGRGADSRAAGTRPVR